MDLDNETLSDEEYREACLDIMQMHLTQAVKLAQQLKMSLIPFIQITEATWSVQLEPRHTSTRG